MFHRRLKTCMFERLDNRISYNPLIRKNARKTPLARTFCLCNPICFKNSSSPPRLSIQYRRHNRRKKQDYRSVLEYRSCIAQTSKFPNQMTRKLPTIRSNFSYESWLKLFVIFKNVCLEVLRQKLQKLEIVNSDKISLIFFTFCAFSRS